MVLRGVHMTSHDVGAEQEIPAALLFLNNPVPMWVYDLETLRILAANGAATALYGYARDEMAGKRVTDLWASTCAADETLHKGVTDAAPPLSVTRRHRRKDGTLIDVHILAQPMEFRDRAAVLAVAQDVTELKRAADALDGAPGQPPDVVETFIALTKEFEAARTPEAVYAALAARAMALVQATHASVALLSEEGETLAIAETAGAPLSWPDPAVPVVNSRLGWVIRTGRALGGTLLIPEPQASYVDDAMYQGLRPLAIIPIGSGDRAIGALIAARAAGLDSAPFTTAEMHLLGGIAEIAAAAIRRIRVVRRLQHAQARTALALAQAIEAYGGEPGSRAARLAGFATATAGALGCSIQDLEDVRWGARLYDIGMVAIPDDIARKPQQLSEQEWAVIRQHPVIADEVLRSVAQLQRAAALVRHHQERWDGSGYPDGLSGEQIPLGARILAVLEAYAAMTAPRPYRPALAYGAIMAELARSAGTQFDPAVVEAFCAVVTETNGAGPNRGPRGTAGTVPSLPFDEALLTAFQGLPEGARQLVHRLHIEDVELEVEEHLAQVGRWSVELAAAADVPVERRRLLAQAAFVHDVGKLALSRTLLQKPGPLSADERALVAQHVTKGVALLRALEVSEAVVDIVAAHHERWDGTGYPNGLAGDAIPLEARILAIADSFDAMTSERVYHAARTRDEGAVELRRQAGRQFEARLVEMFLSLLQRAQ